jgi:hypothetical protein
MILLINNLLLKIKGPNNSKLNNNLRKKVSLTNFSKGLLKNKQIQIRLQLIQLKIQLLRLSLILKVKNLVKIRKISRIRSNIVMKIIKMILMRLIRNQEGCLKNDKKCEKFIFILY